MLHFRFMFLLFKQTFLDDNGLCSKDEMKMKQLVAINADPGFGRA